MKTLNRRVILLAGAPDAGSLTWDEASLTAPLEPPFVNTGRSINPQASQSISSRPVWRSIEFNKGSAPPLPQSVFVSNDDRGDWVKPEEPPSSTKDETTRSSYSEAGEGPNPGPSTFILADLEAPNAFYEHSFAMHEDSTTFLTASSQSFDDSSPSSNVEHSFIQTQGSKAALSAPHLTKLGAVPRTTYIRSIEPQTMAVDLVVGIVAVAAPRSITTRRTKRQMDMVELNVGDESRSAFTISIWLPAQSENFEETGNLNPSAKQLCPHDIILMRNVGLYVFRDQVHGQSLRRGLTSLQILHRKGTSRGEVQAYYSAEDLELEDTNDSCLLRTRAVRDWLVGHVAPDTNAPGLRDRTRANHARDPLQTLPLDTQ